jgi:hypothetical protein
MAVEPTCAVTPKWMFYTGWVLSLLSTLPFLPSIYFKFAQPEWALQKSAEQGWEAGPLITLGIVELGCVIIYLNPGTAILGAILMTGYLGGAIATHAPRGEPFFIPLILGVFAWLGIYLRDDKLRAILPWRPWWCPSTPDKNP